MAVCHTQKAEERRFWEGNRGQILWILDLQQEDKEGGITVLNLGIKQQIHILFVSLMILSTSIDFIDRSKPNNTRGYLRIHAASRDSKSIHNAINASESAFL